MMIPCKDPVKIVYLDVAFQGEEGGRLALRSRSMTFFSEQGERKGNVAWNSIAKVHTGAVKNATEEKYLLKILNNNHQSLTFHMKNEADLDSIRGDIQDCIKAYKELASDPDQKPSTGAEDNSLTDFPRFVSEDESTRSALTRNVGSVQEPTRSVNTRSIVGSSRSLASRHTTSPSQRTMEGGGSLAYSKKHHSMKGDVMVDEDIDASTIASTNAGSVLAGDGISLRDVEEGAPCNKSHRSLQPTKTFNEDDYVAPVATFHLVPEEKPANFNGYYIPHEMIPRKKKCWRSKWLLLALLLIGLLLLGMGIGMGMMSSKNKRLEGQANAVVGQEDSTGSDGPIDIDAESPTDAPSINEFVAAMERTSSPTSVQTFIPSMAPSPLPTLAPTIDACKRVGHAQAMNTRKDAYEAGTFGGSSYCRASIVTLCEYTEWVPFNTFQGVGDAWFIASALEDSFCVADVEHQIQLRVPEGVDYDLHVYKTMSGVAYDSSTLFGTNGRMETVVVSADDKNLSDQSFGYKVHVEFKEGSSCEPWTVQFFGHQCL